MSKLYYLLFVIGFTFISIIYIYTGFNKHRFYGDRLFGGLKIYSSQLVLTSTAFYKLYHFGTEMAHVSRCAVKPY